MQRGRRRRNRSGLRRNLLCIAPPSPIDYPPAGPAYLLGFLKRNGIDEFDFLDLGLGIPEASTPTYAYMGAFAESYVMDIPDLPLILKLLAAFDAGKETDFSRDVLFDEFCSARCISPVYLEQYLLLLNRYLRSVFDQIPDIEFIGFSVWTPNFLSTLLVAALLKRRENAPFIVMGGPQVTSSSASADLALTSGLADIVAIGEGEMTLMEVFTEFARKGDVKRQIPGTAIFDPTKKTVVRNRRPLLRLHDLPRPSFDEMHLQAYQHEQGFRTVPMQLSRGCTDKCEFCSEWLFWERIRLDTIDHAIGTIEELKGRYAVNNVVFSDSLLNAVNRHLLKFATELIDRDLDITWSAFMRAQMDRETADVLLASGCNDVFIGIESFSDETLARMRKRRNQADNIAAITAFLDAGIGVTAGFIPGFPGDSRAGFNESVRVFRELQKRYPGQLAVQMEPFTLQSGAPMMAELDKFNLEGKPWARKYLDIAPRYAPMLESLLCEVVGDNQGIERLGKFNLVKSIALDGSPGEAYSFHAAEDELLNTQQFELSYMIRGWHLARIKGPVGQIYALLVNDDEKEELEAATDEMYVLDFEDARFRRLLSRIEKEHVVPPGRRSTRLVRSKSDDRGIRSTKYEVSPFVVARLIGQSKRGKLLAVNFITLAREVLGSKVDQFLVRELRRAPMTNQALRDSLGKESGCSVTIDAKLRGLLSKGIVTNCGAF